MHASRGLLGCPHREYITRPRGAEGDLQLAGAEAVGEGVAALDEPALRDLGELRRRVVGQLEPHGLHLAKVAHRAVECFDSIRRAEEDEAVVGVVGEDGIDFAAHALDLVEPIDDHARHVAPHVEHQALERRACGDHPARDAECAQQLGQRLGGELLANTEVARDEHVTHARRLAQRCAREAVTPLASAVLLDRHEADQPLERHVDAGELGRVGGLAKAGDLAILRCAQPTGDHGRLVLSPCSQQAVRCRLPADCQALLSHCEAAPGGLRFGRGDQGRRMQGC
eukprot:jgi/Chrpa1/10014/Chrysochromulina_OHIO_Genome00014105-RA